MISVVVPVYNAAQYLSECLESIIKQTYSDIEIICVNDGSSDNSELIIAQYMEKDARIRYFAQTNAGVSAARNLALDVATGDWVCFVDSDDIIDRNFLNNLLSLAKDNGMSICGYTRDILSLGRKSNKTENFNNLDFIHTVIDESRCSPNICMMLFKNSIIQKENIRFTVGCVRNEDTEFYLKYMTYIDNVTTTDYIGYFYRDNPNSAVHKFNDKSLTYIEAAERIVKFLRDKGVVGRNNCLVLEAAVQYFIYHLARQNNKLLYDKLHDTYNVRRMMKSMLSFPRKSRKGVALAYLTMGRTLFFNIMSRLFKE